MGKTVLFWDIDGTLLTTRRAGVRAWEEAATEVVGRPVTLEHLKADGTTDHQVAAAILKHAGEEPVPERAERMTRIYERRLPAALPSKQGEVLPSVREILAALEGRPDVVCLLLTGNTRLGAKAKLEHYGLSAYLQEGAFSDDGGDRPTIARKALELAKARHGEPKAAFVIGDTPHDIACGKAIGAMTVAVATGPYKKEELAGHGPWWAVDALPAPAEFAERLGIA